MIARQRIESLISKWEKFCVEGGWLSEPLTERARIALVTELSELMAKMGKRP